MKKIPPLFKNILIIILAALSPQIILYLALVFIEFAVSQKMFQGRISAIGDMVDLLIGISFLALPGVISAFLSRKRDMLTFIVVVGLSQAGSYFIEYYRAKSLSLYINDLSFINRFLTSFVVVTVLAWIIKKYLVSDKKVRSARP